MGIWLIYTHTVDFYGNCRWHKRTAVTWIFSFTLFTLASSGAWCCPTAKCINVGRNHSEFFKERGPEIAGTSLQLLSTLCWKITGVILDDLQHLREARGHLKGEDYCSGPSTSLTHWIIDAAISAEGLPKGSTNTQIVLFSSPICHRLLLHKRSPPWSMGTVEAMWILRCVCVQCNVLTISTACKEI